MKELYKFLPHDHILTDTLYNDEKAIIKNLLARNLLIPLQNFFIHPGKNFRSQLIEIGHSLGHDEEIDIETEDILKKIEFAGSIVEFIHAGSLIVDDIQDGSEVRRGAPAFHLIHGIPLALNTGNWLYFWALSKVKDLELPPEAFSELMNDLLSFMMKAHEGQAIDLGTPIDELPLEDIPNVTQSSTQLKTGVLLNFSLRLGNAISRRKWCQQELMLLGNELGLILQMFDDFSSLATPKFSHPTKRYEDLILRRPSWVWSEVSLLGEEVFKEFQFSVNELPDERLLTKWLREKKFIPHLWERAHNKVQTIKSRWRSVWKDSHPQTLKKLFALCEELENSYVKKY